MLLISALATYCQLKNFLYKTIGIINFAIIFTRRYYDLISEFNIGLKSHLRQGISEPEFFGDLMYKLKQIVGSNNFSAQLIKNNFSL